MDTPHYIDLSEEKEVLYDCLEGCYLSERSDFGI